VRGCISDELYQSYLVPVKTQMQHSGKSEKWRARASTQMRQHTSLGLSIPRARRMLFEINTDHYVGPQSYAVKEDLVYK